MSNIVNNLAIIIPARLNSVRLKTKPLQLIGQYSLIEHVYMRATRTKLPVYVATDSDKIAEKIERLNGNVIMTDPKCMSGTDRVYQALEILGKEYQYIVNLQGDIPFIDVELLSYFAKSLINSNSDILTLAAPIEHPDAKSIVKVVVNQDNKALYFSRSLIPYNATKYLGHIGIYGFNKKSLKKFVNLPASKLEHAEKLEQLRALDYGMNIEIIFTDTMPLSVDTSEDLAIARKLILKN